MMVRQLLCSFSPTHYFTVLHVATAELLDDREEEDGTTKSHRFSYLLSLFL